MEQCLAEGLMLTGSDDCFECLAFRVSNKTREVEYMADSYKLAFWRQQGRLNRARNCGTEQKPWTKRD